MSLQKRKLYYNQSYPSSGSVFEINTGASNTISQVVRVGEKGQVQIKFALNGYFGLNPFTSFPTSLMINVLRDGESIIFGNQYLLSQVIRASLNNTMFIPKFNIVDEDADTGYHTYDIVLTNTTPIFPFVANSYSLIIETGEIRHVKQDPYSCDPPSKDISVNQKFSLLGTYATSLAAGGTLPLDIDIVVTETSDIQLELNLSEFFNTGPSINTQLSRTFTRNRIPIPDNLSYENSIISANTPADYNMSYGSDIILVDKAVSPGKYTYSVLITNTTGSVVANIPYYCFTVVQKKSGIVTNQLFNQPSIYSVIPSSLTSPAIFQATVESSGKRPVQIEFNGVYAFILPQVVENYFEIANYSLVINNTTVINNQPLINFNNDSFTQTTFSTNIPYVTLLKEGTNLIQFLITQSSGVNLAISLINYSLNVSES